MTKILVGLGGVALLLYFVFKKKNNFLGFANASGKKKKKKKDKSGMSQAQKEALFLSTIRPQRATPLPIMLQKAENFKYAKIQKQIDDLGLREEYNVWYANYKLSH